jgi:hypothetical protein
MVRSSFTRAMMRCTARRRSSTSSISALASMAASVSGWL